MGSFFQLEKCFEHVNKNSNYLLNFWRRISNKFQFSIIDQFFLNLKIYKIISIFCKIWKNCKFYKKLKKISNVKKIYSNLHFLKKFYGKSAVITNKRENHLFDDVCATSTSDWTGKSFRPLVLPNLSDWEKELLIPFVVLIYYRRGGGARRNHENRCQDLIIYYYLFEMKKIHL